MEIIGYFLAIPIGVYLSRLIDGARLKKGFGYFIMAIAVFISTMEFII